MKKNIKSFRLSEEAIRIIESRDKEKYPRAADFIEEKISIESDDVSEILSKISRLLGELEEKLGEKNVQPEPKEDPKPAENSAGENYYEEKPGFDPEWPLL